MRFIPIPARVLVVTTACLLAVACTTARKARTNAARAKAALTRAEQAAPGDPTKAAVPLPSAGDWDAYLVIDSGATGIWTVEAFQVFDQYASPEVVGLDDHGRCRVLVSYSGKWAPIDVVHDGKWLGGLAHGDLDPRIPGAEIYTGGQNGNLYQLAAYPQGALDSRLIAYLPGREIHTIVAGDLDASSPGSELLVFTRPGALYRLSPTGADGTFEVVKLQELPGRVRDAVVLPATADAAPEIATVSRAGRLQLLQIVDGRPQWTTTVHRDSMGKGRLALRPGREGEPLVLYSSLDDGRILRHERAPSGDWETEVIYLGPQGPRGIAAGRFHEDPSVETVAVFGYSRRVELLTRRGASWKVETVFTDRDKGHWLSAAELDGRNSTTEIIGSGYGGRIFMLSRPPGYGMRGVTATEKP